MATYGCVTGAALLGDGQTWGYSQFRAVAVAVAVVAEAGASSSDVRGLIEWVRNAVDVAKMRASGRNSNLFRGAAGPPIRRFGVMVS